MSFLPHQISLGELADLMRFATLALAAIVSAFVLADARRRRFPFYVVAGFTLGTLFLPLVVLPLYILFCIFIPRTQRTRTPPRTNGNASSSPRSGKRVAPAIRWRFLLPLAYAIVALSFIAFRFYNDYTSADAHLMRAGQARLHGQRQQAISEIRDALLSAPNDAHTHNLLAAALAANDQWPEALAEYRAAERMGEPDDELPFRIATVLDKLKRKDEAIQEYRRFTESVRCAQKKQFDTQCETARVRIQAETRR